MLLQENGTHFCTEGKVFTIGGIICANDESEYAGLCGTVMEIRSGDDRETENDTPDIYYGITNDACRQRLSRAIRKCRSLLDCEK